MAVKEHLRETPDRGIGHGLLHHLDDPGPSRTPRDRPQLPRPLHRARRTGRRRTRRLVARPGGPARPAPGTQQRPRPLPAGDHRLHRRRPGRAPARHPLDVRHRHPRRPGRRTPAGPLVRGADRARGRPGLPRPHPVRLPARTAGPGPGRRAPAAARPPRRLAAHPAPGGAARPHPPRGRRHRRLHHATRPPSHRRPRPRRPPPGRRRPARPQPRAADRLRQRGEPPRTARARRRDPGLGRGRPVPRARRLPRGRAAGARRTRPHPPLRPHRAPAAPACGWHAWGSGNTPCWSPTTTPSSTAGRCPS